MRKKIDSALAEIKTSYEAGLLRWNYETVQGLITPYPKRGQLDTLKPGQEDEATPDPDQVPWEVAKETHEEAIEGGDAVDKDADDDQDDDIAEYDPQDWHEPIEKLSGSNDGDEEPQIQSVNHGDGDGRNEKDEGCGQTLDAEQTNTLIEHSERLRSLHQAKEIGG